MDVWNTDHPAWTPSGVATPRRRTHSNEGGRLNLQAKDCWGPVRLTLTAAPSRLGSLTYLVSTQRETGEGVQGE